MHTKSKKHEKYEFLIKGLKNLHNRRYTMLMDRETKFEDINPFEIHI